MDKVFVSGCGGRIGAALCQRLIDAGYEVGGCDNFQFGYEKNVPEGVELHKVGVAEISDAVINKYDVLISCHTANIVYGMDNMFSTWRTNCIDTLLLFGRFNGKIINLSTSSVYGNAESIPTTESDKISLTNSYAYSKYCAELFLSDRGNYTNLRLTNTYGGVEHPEYPYKSVIGKMVVEALNGKPIEVIGDGSQTRDFVYVQDVIDAVILCVEQEAHNATVNIGSGVEVGIIELSMQIMKQIEANTTGVAARPIDNVNRRCLNIERANYMLGWVPKTSLQEGIKRTIEWYRSLG